MSFSFLERGSLLEQLLGQRTDLTEDDKQQALQNFLRGEPVGLTPLEGWADRHRAENKAALERGNIDLFGREPVANPDGTTSTVRSISANIDGREVLIPTVVGGRVVSDDEAIAEYRRSGQHLGIFASPGDATVYAKKLHDDYEAGKYEKQAPDLTQRESGIDYEAAKRPALALLTGGERLLSAFQPMLTAPTIAAVEGGRAAASDIGLEGMSAITQADTPLAILRDDPAVLEGKRLEAEKREEAERAHAMKALSAAPAGFQEIGTRLIEGSAALVAAFSADKDEDALALAQTAIAKKRGGADEATKLAHSLGLLGPGDVTEEKAGEALFPEVGVGQEVSTELFKLIDPDTAGALASLAVKGGFLALTQAAKGSRLLKRQVFNEAAKEGSEFARQTARAAIETADPERVAAWVDAIEDTGFAKKGGNVDAMAAYIQKYGVDTTVERGIFKLSKEEGQTLKAVLGQNQPADFGTRIQRFERQQSREREQLVELISSNDPASELMLVGQRQKAATILSQELDMAQVEAAKARGLTVATVNLSDLPKGRDRARIVYDPELVGAIQEGLRLSDNQGLRSLAEYGKTPDEFVRTLARKNPRQLAILSAGGLQSDYAGQATVRLTIGGQQVAERTVNAADMVPTARWFVDQARVAREAGAQALAGDIRRALPEAILGEGEAFLARATKGKIGVQFVGQPIEQLAAMSGIGLDGIRMVQTRLADLGLTHPEATTLAGTLSGTASPIARQSILIEAAKTIKAAKPKKFPDVQSAAGALRQALEEIDSKLPARAKFFRFEKPQGPSPVILRERLLKGEVYWDPVEQGFRPRQPDVDPPGYAVFDPDQAGKPVVARGIDLSTVSPAEAENLVRYGHKHPPIPTETPVGTIMRKLTGQSEETVVAQVTALEDNLVQRMQAEVGDSFTPEAIREFLFGPDPQAVLNGELRRVGIDAVRPTGAAPGSHGQAIAAMQEQAFAVRQALRQEYEASGLVKAKLAAEELQALENGQLQAAVDLRQVQARRMQLSEEAQRLDKQLWDAAGRQDDATMDAVQARMDAIAPEMAALRERAMKLDGAITETEVKSAERAARAGKDLNLSDEVAASARRSSPPELVRYTSGEEAYVSAARRFEGKSEGQARAEFQHSLQPGWGQQIPPGSPAGPNNPKMHEAAGKGDPMDSSELLRMDRELSGVTRYKVIARTMRSPLTSIPRSLGLRDQLATWTTVQIEQRLRYMERAMQEGVLRKRVLPDASDRFLAGRLIENDAAAIPRPWLDEVLDGQTPKSQAVREYMAMVRDATKRVADHAEVPVTQRLRDYFGRFRLHDSKAIKQMLVQRIGEARKAGQLDVVKTLEGELDTWARSEVGLLNAYDREWIPDSMLNYGPLEERLDKVWEYVQDPEQMLGIANAMAARYRFLKDTLPAWNKAIERAGGRITEQGVVKTAAGYSDVVDRLVEGRRGLWEPPDKFSTAWRRKVAELMQHSLGQKVAKHLSPTLLNDISQFARKAGFMMHIGGRTSTALVNLTSIPLHVMTRMHPSDVSRGVAHFLYDQAVSGDMARGVVGLEGLMSELGPRYGRGMSHIRPLYDDAVTGLKVHWWELGEGATDPGVLRRMAGGAGEAAFDALALGFRSTEAFNRGATFYAQTLRAFDALEEFRKTGKLSSRYYDGWIAPTETDLLKDWKTLKARVPASMRAAEPGAGVLTPTELGRIKTIDMAKGSDLDKAKAYFDPERGIREALVSDDPTKWAKDRGVAAMSETQGSYNRMNRPKLVQDYAAWAEMATQFLDFGRQQIEMFAQRLSAPQKLAFLTMLYAIGGPRALPMVEWMIEGAGFMGPEGEKLEAAIAEFEKEGGVFAGLGPATGQDVAGRMKMNLPLAGLKAGKAGQTPGQRIISVLGGASVAPLVEAHSGISEAADTTQHMAEKLGIPIAEAAKVQVRGPRDELRQQVKASEIGAKGASGAVLANPAVQAVLNVPAKGLMSLSRIFEELGAEGMASYTAAAGESIQVRESERPGYLDLPGDRILASSGMLRDLVRGAKLAETGATSRRGRVGTIVTSEMQRKLGQALGMSQTADVLERKVINDMSKAADVAKGAQSKSIDWAIEHWSPETNRRATPTEIADHLQGMGWGTVTPAQVRGRIFARSNPLVGRFAAELSKQGVQDLYQLEGLRERLIETVEAAREVGNEAAAAAAMTTFLDTRRSFYTTQLEANPKATRALQAVLAKDLAEVPDPQMPQLFMDAFATGIKNKAGDYTMDLDMVMLHRIAEQGDEALLERFSRIDMKKGGIRDEAERQQLLVIGLYLMELRQQQPGMSQNLTDAAP